MRTSNLPGLNKASSTKSGLVVHAITNTPFLSSIPSISFNKVLRTRSVTPALLDSASASRPRRFPINSTSSRNIIQGAKLDAVWKRLRILLSDSPRYLLKMSVLFLMPARKEVRTRLKLRGRRLLKQRYVLFRSDKVHVERPAQRLNQPSFSAAARSEQQQSSRRFDTQPFIHIWRE